MASVTLRFRPPVGTVARYLQTTSLRQTGPGTAKPIVSITTVPIRLRIVSCEGGVTTIESRTGKSKVDLPAGSPLATMKAGLEQTGSDVVATVRVDETGNVLTSKLDVQGPGADFVRRLGAGVAKGVQGIRYPKRPLKVGDAWTDTLDFGKAFATLFQGGSAKAEGKGAFGFRLIGVTGGLARVAVTMSGQLVVRDRLTDLKTVMRVAGESTTDVATGLVRASTSTLDQTMTIQGQAIHQHVVTTLKAL